MYIYIPKRGRNYLSRFHITELQDNSNLWGLAETAFYHQISHQNEKISIKMSYSNSN